jgi:LacI family transcriptional regulator
MAAKKRVTGEDVARRAKVSVAVVSYVVNNGPRPVSAETRARVEKAIEELWYYPNQVARSLRLQQSSTVGLMLPNLTNMVYAEMAAGVERLCSLADYLVLVGYSERNLTKEKNFIKTLRAKQVDGVVMLPSQDPALLVQSLQQRHIPVVVIEHLVPGIHCVTLEHLKGGLLAAEHLLRLGHRRIGYIRRPPASVSTLSADRFNGYCQALESAGIPFEPSLVIKSEAGLEGGYQAMQQLLALPDPPTAVCAHNDILALGAIHAIRSAGLTVPADISIVGFDDIAIAAFSGPPLTTIRFSGKEMGRQAARLLLQLIQEPDGGPAQTVRLPVELVERASTVPPRERR